MLEIAVATFARCVAGNTTEVEHIELPYENRTAAVASALWTPRRGRAATMHATKLSRPEFEQWMLAEAKALRRLACDAAR